MKQVMVILVLCAALSLHAQDQDTKTITEDRRETLMYGIDNEVLSLLDDLQDEKNTELADEIVEQFEISDNVAIKRRIMEYFTAMELNQIEDQVLELLYDDPVNEGLILSLLNYIGEFEIKDAAPAVLNLANDTRSSVAVGAVKTIGILGLTESIDTLKDIFDDDDSSDALQSEILLTLGKLKDESSLEMLLDLVDDPDEDRSNRWYACAALGEIQGERAYEAVKNALDDDDTILRTYAIRAIAKFDLPEAENILIHEGLRDSFWKVRLSAIESIEKQMIREAGGALRYKASRDPEAKIRERAIEALGKIGGSDNLSFLKELMLDEKKSVEIRRAAAVTLIQNNADDCIDELDKLIVMEWDRENSRLLEFAAKELSVTKFSGSGRLFEKLLAHEEYVIRIYAVRGIGLNGISSLKEKIETLNTESAHPSMKKAVITAIDQIEN